LITGTTRVAGVIGDPVRHSRSPAIHNAAFAAAGLDWVYVAFEVGEGEVPSALAGMRALGLAGLNVTMPHKQAVADAVDWLTPDAQALDAVNTVVLGEGRRLVGHNTDGAGFVDSLVVDSGISLAGLRCAVLGAGGAGRAVVRALAGAGAAEVVVVNRTPAAAERAVALAGDVGRLGTTLDLADADLVVNATPLGMGADRSLPCDPEALGGAGQVVVDLVYDPPETAWIAAARARGIRVVGGLGMLVHQAAHAFTLWTGVEAPLAAMRAAAEAHAP
jgi:shikimate dehydrogenase